MWKNGLRILMEGEPDLTGGGGAGGAPVIPPAPVPAPNLPGGGGAGGGQHGDKVVPMQRSTLAKLTRDHEDKGRKSADDAMQKRAVAAGFASVDEMVKAAEQFKKRGQAGNGNGGKNNKGGQQQRQADPPPAQQRGNDRAQRASDAKFERERKDRIAAQKKAEMAQQELYATEARGELMLMAYQAGIKEPDFAIQLLTRECEQQRTKLGESEYARWVDKLDEKEFFSGLKKTKPFLFQETIVLAETGTQTGTDAPPPPGAGKVAERQAANAQKKAQQMSKEEYEAKLRSMRLTPPSL